MNKEQTHGLIQLRHKFLADQEKLASIEVGTLHSNLENLTIGELRYLGNFTQVMRSSLVDLELSNEQLVEDTSPISDLAKAASQAYRTAEALELKFEEVKKAFLDDMKSGFRLESVMENPKYNLILEEVGLKHSHVTHKFLNKFDVVQQVRDSKKKVLDLFGFNELIKMYKPGGPALRLDRLIEENFDGAEGEPNPALFEAIAAEIVDQITTDEYGIIGFVKQGNVRLKIAHPKDIGTTRIPKNEMRIVEIGVRPKAFTINENIEESFPNIPGLPHKADMVSEVEEIATTDRKFRYKGSSGLFFDVTATVYRKQATFYTKFGSVTVKPSGLGIVKKS